MAINQDHDPIPGVVEVVRTNKDFDSVLKGRPTNNSDNGYAWDIAVKFGRDWFDLFLPKSGGPSISQLAKNLGVDSVALMVALVSRHGFTPPNFEVLGKTAKKFANRPETQSIDQWIEQNFPDRWKRITTPVSQQDPGGKYTPENIIAGTRGYAQPAITPTSPGSAEKQTLFQRVSDNPQWATVMPGLGEIARRTYRLPNGQTVPGIGINNLFAVLWSQGFSAQEIKASLNGDERIVTKAARALATFTSGTLDNWYSKNKGKLPLSDRGNRGRPSPDKFLGVVETNRAIPTTSGQTKKDREKTLDFTDPKVKGKDGKPIVIGGQPVRETQYGSLFNKYADLTQWYQGRNPTQEEVVNWLQKGTTSYQIGIELSKDPSFFRSPAWKKAAVSYKGIYRDTVGGGKLPKNLIRKAIVLSWSPGDFQEALRGTESYLTGNEFNDASTKLMNQYTSIMGGAITSTVRNTVKEATLARWSPDMFGSWLRAQPEYGTSVEYQGRMNKVSLALANMMGTSPKRVEGVVPNPPAAFAIPDSERLEGSPGLKFGEPNRQRVEKEANSPEGKEAAVVAKKKARAKPAGNAGLRAKNLAKQKAARKAAA